MINLLRSCRAALPASNAQSSQQRRRLANDFATFSDRFSSCRGRRFLSASVSPKRYPFAAAAAPTGGARRARSGDNKAPDYFMYLAMPKLSPTMTSGKITKWLKAEGDEINEYDPILELDTDSLYDEGQAPRSGPTAMIIEITEAGYVGKLFAEEGDLIEAGVPIMAICEEKDGLEAARNLQKPEVDLNADGAFEKFRIATFQGYLNAERNTEANKD